MKVFMIGGTGLLGSEAAAQMIQRGHEVSTLSLPPLPEGAALPPEMKISFGNFNELSDAELRAHMEGCEGLVFAAGVDERIEGKAPIYELFKKYNITPLQRLLRLAKESGVKHAAICGSYFSYFAKERPKLRLTHFHPYIRSRIDQEKMALSFAGDGFNVAVLELPYIFGVQPGRRPVWVFLVEMIRGMKLFTMFPRGGTSMVTLKQAGQAIVGALERTSGGVCWPIGWYNKSWKEFLTSLHKYMGMPGRKILTIPKWVFSIAAKKIFKKQRKKGIEGGLNMNKICDIQCSEFFIDKSLGSLPLGVTEDDIESAIGDSAKLSMEILDGKEKDAVDMKGE